MKRFFAVVLSFSMIFVLCSCHSSIVPSKRTLPQIPVTFRRQTVIGYDGKTLKAVTDFGTDGTAEFFITEHNSLKGVTFRCGVADTQIIIDNVSISVDSLKIPEKAVFFKIANALRTVTKSVSEPSVGDTLVRYDYPDSGFRMFVDIESGKTVSLIFDNSLYVKFLD